MSTTFEKLFGFDSRKHNVPTEIMAGITTFLTMGTLIGVHQSIGMADPKAKQDEVPDMDKMFMADSVATVCGALPPALTSMFGP